MGEIWRTVEEFPDYEVSNLGRVRSMKRANPIILTPWKHKFGYDFVSLSVRGQKQYKRLIHGLVCHAFHGPKPSPSHEVAHADGSVENNSADNLRWATPKENNADKHRHGTHLNDGQFKPFLTEDNIREIRRLLAGGNSTYRIAKMFFVSQAAISHIKLGRRWSQVK